MTATLNNTSVRSWEDNAEEFGALVRGEGGWPLAVLVACSVGSLPQGVHGDKLQLISGKVTASDFAKKAGVTQPTISKYLVKWEEAIKAGAPVPPASELKPSDVGTFPLPARPFNGQPTKRWPQGGYVETKNQAANGTETIVDAIITGSQKGGGPLKVTSSIAASSAAMTKLIEAAAKGPKVIETVIAEMDDQSFEVLSDAITAATTPAPATITNTGVKPAVTPSAAKVASVHKAAAANIGAAIKANPKVYEKAEAAVTEVKVEAIQKKFAAKFPPVVLDDEALEAEAQLANGTAKLAGVGAIDDAMLFNALCVFIYEAGDKLDAAADLLVNSTGKLDELSIAAMKEELMEHVTKKAEALAIQAEFKSQF